MTNVLFFVDPHPIRNTFAAFMFPVEYLMDSVIRLHRKGFLRFRVYSNTYIMQKISTTYGERSGTLFWPTEAEENIFRSYHRAWDEEAIQLRKQLTQGVGVIADQYYDILERIYSDFPFDLLLTWSDNGAVRRFASDRGVPTLHFELGPTRLPFNETIYFDLKGTNGAASVVDAPLDQLVGDEDLVAPEAWAAASDVPYPNYENFAPIDAAMTLGGHLGDMVLPRRYVYIPLQLADDLNTIDHSPFDSPEHFLRSVMPWFVDNGYSVVVKGHPSAPINGHNLAHEESALQYARSFGDRAKVLNRTIGSAASIFAVGQAELVCTINSSVGYEALLLGKPVVTLGRAIYDVGGKLGLTVDTLSDFNFDRRHAERLSTFLGRHYFHPSVFLRAGNILETAINFSLSNFQDKKTASFWRSWIRTIDFGDRSLMQDRSAFELPAFPHVFIAKNNLLGNIDKVSDSYMAGASGLKLQGWTYDPATEEPLASVSAFRLGKSIPVLLERYGREDVNAHLRVDHKKVLGFSLYLPFVRASELSEVDLYFEIGDAVHRVSLKDGFASAFDKRSWRKSLVSFFRHSDRPPTAH